MELNQLKQEAGNNSEQFQAGVVNNFIIGITEERARVIIDEKIENAIKNLTIEAKAIAKERAQKFAEELVPRLVEENLLNSLREPRVQVALVEAQKEAVCTDKKIDYRLLTEMLVSRTKEIENGNRYMDSSIEYASKMVNKISSDSLLALTILYTTELSRVVTGSIKEGVKQVSQMLSSVLIGQLPKGDQWIDHLYMLGAINILVVVPRKSFKDLIANIYNGYVEVGIKKESENYYKALKILEECGINNKVLISHELRPGYMRLAMPYKNISKIVVTGEDFLVCDITNPSRQEAIRQVYVLYEQDKKLKQENIEALAALCNTFEPLREVKKWWDSIPVHTRLTPSGIALASANALLYNDTFPRNFSI